MYLGTKLVNFVTSRPRRAYFHGLDYYQLHQIKYTAEYIQRLLSYSVNWSAVLNARQITNFYNCH